MADYNGGGQARLAYAVALREVADFARGLVGDVGGPLVPGQLIRNTSRVRLLGLSALDRAVLIEALAGTSWETIADALVMPVDEVRKRYEETVALWSTDVPVEELNAVIYGDHTTGLRHDHDPQGTAAALDQWHNRHAQAAAKLDDWYNAHAEPWDGEDTPVTRALTTH